MSKKKLEVYVVDDEKLIALNFKKNIERTNEMFLVTGVFHNAEDALLAISEKQPDFLFTDIYMPVTDGIELIRILHEKYPDILCIIVSGYSEFAYAKEAIRYGVVDYLLKPINRDELASLLDKLLISYKNKLDLSELDTQHDTKDIVSAVKNHIEAHYNEAIDLGSIAQSIGFSPAYLTKIFQAEMNITPSRYLRDYRIQAAKKLLKKTNLPIALVGEKCGYPDSFHFSKTFRNATGCTPSNYRLKTELQ